MYTHIAYHGVETNDVYIYYITLPSNSFGGAGTKNKNRIKLGVCAPPEHEANSSVDRRASPTQISKKQNQMSAFMHRVHMMHRVHRDMLPLHTNMGSVLPTLACNYGKC